MKTKKNDFIELQFTGKTQDGQIFDTTNSEEAKNSGLALNEKDYTRFKPIKLCIGQEMILKALDKFLEDKELEKEYELEVKSKEAYGKRDIKLVRTVPLTAFQEMPQKGMFVNVNGLLAKVISINSGRVLLDMNHPLAGKDLFYKFKILKIIENKEEKVQIILEFFNVKKENFSVEENKIIVKEKVQERIKSELTKKVKELFSLEIDFQEKPKKLEENLENQ